MLGALGEVRMFKTSDPRHVGLIYGKRKDSC